MLAFVMVILKMFFCWFLVVLVVNLIVLVVGIVRVGIDKYWYQAYCCWYGRCW